MPRRQAIKTTIVRLDRTAALICAGTLGKAGLLELPHAVPVLMYHSVSETDERSVSPYYRLTISPARFRDHMRLLAEEGYAVCSLTDAFRGMDEGPLARRRVVITFDDGYLDFLVGAWPALAEFSFTATVFLPTAFIGDRRRSFKGRECLTWAEVRDLSRLGVSFGSHSISHPVLHELDWPQVSRELRLSREEIEREIGRSVNSFAYPFAFPQQDAGFVSAFCQELRDIGYHANVTTTVGRYSPGDDPMLIKRLPANDADDPRLFFAKLSGAYDWLGSLQSVWKRVR